VYHTICLTEYGHATSRAQADLPCARCKLTPRESEALSLQQQQQQQQQQRQQQLPPQLLQLPQQVQQLPPQVLVFSCSGQPLINLSAVNRL
jgi:hypothetical protein